MTRLKSLTNKNLLECWDCEFLCSHATSMSVIKSRTPEQEGWCVRGNLGFLHLINKNS